MTKTNEQISGTADVSLRLGMAAKTRDSKVKLDDWDDDQVLIGRIRPRGKNFTHLLRASNIHRGGKISNN